MRRGALRRAGLFVTLAGGARVALAAQPSDGGLDIGRIALAGPATIGILATVGLLVYLALRRRHSPPGWRRPLGALAALGLLTLTTILGAIRPVRDALPPVALASVAVLVDLLAVTLAAFLWKGARWAWRVAAVLCAPTAVLIVALAVVLSMRGAPPPLLELLSVTIALASVPLFVLAVLLHRDVASDFVTREAKERGSAVPSSSAVRWISALDWPRLIALFSLAAGLSLTAFMAAVVTDPGGMGGPAATAGAWALFALSILVVSASGWAWRGARWARWVLVSGASSVLLLALVAAGALALESGSATSADRAGAAALLLFPPLLALTVLLHGDVARAFDRRREAVQAAPRRRRLARHLTGAAAAAAIALLIVAGTQYEAFARERARLVAQAEALRRNILALETTAAKLPEFQREVRVLEAKLDDVRKIIPPTPEVDAFIEQLARVARETGVSIESWTAHNVSKELYDQTTIDLRLTGAQDNIERLATRVESLTRLAVWHTLRSSPLRTTATVTIYAMADPVARPRRVRAAGRGSRVWLWPYTRALRPYRATLAAREQRVHELEAIRVQVQRLERERDVLLRLRSVFERLRKEKTTLGSR